MCGNVEMCELLLFSNADVNAKDWRYHPYPHAVDSNMPNVYCCILFLIFCFIRQMTALHYSYGRLHRHLQHVELCKLLLSYGTDVDAKNQYF
jgi:hypothetical protein